MESHILCAVYPQDVAEVLESPDLLDGSDTLTVEGHRSYAVPTAYRNLTNVLSCMKLQVVLLAKVLEEWTWIWLPD